MIITQPQAILATLLCLIEGKYEGREEEQATRRKFSFYLCLRKTKKQIKLKMNL